MITTTEQLEEILTRPTGSDCEALRELEGDLLILGVGGKMGPSLAVRAKRAIDEAGVRKPASKRFAPICWIGMLSVGCQRRPTRSSWPAGNSAPRAASTGLGR